MAVTRVSCRLTAAVIITVLQIRALISVKAKVVTGVEGQPFDFRCDYPPRYTNQAKYFSHYEDDQLHNALILSEKHNQWRKRGRFALYDNTSGAFFTVRVNKLEPHDGGRYCCGVDVLNNSDHTMVIELIVSQVNEVIINPTEITKLSLPLQLSAVASVSALLFVCVFTIGLLLTVRHRREGSRRNRETSSDYESMMPGVRTEPECHQCSDPGCTEPAAISSGGGVSPRLTSKQRESAISLSLSDYVDVDLPRCICQYQHLDPSSLENHVYHSLVQNSHAEQEPSKEMINSYC